MHRLVLALVAISVLGGVLVPVLATPVDAAPGDTAQFVAVTPARVLDTRLGIGAPVGAVGAGGSIDVTVQGRGGVPVSAVIAVVLNVTVDQAIGPGFTQVYPTGATALAGTTSNLNIEQARQTMPNAVVVPVGTNGRVTIYTQGGGHLLADVSGYFLGAADARSGRYVDVAPSRLVDTRNDGSGRLASAETRLVPVSGHGGVPASGVSAVVLNVTAVDAAPGYWQLVPNGAQSSIGASSNLNVERSRQTIANLVIVPVGTSGALLAHTESGGHLLIDVMGYFTDASAARSTAGLFVPLAPRRALDSRTGAIPEARTRRAVGIVGRSDLGIPDDGVRAILGNVTSTQAANAGWVQALPGGSPSVGGWSNLNVARVGQTIANAVVANVGDDGNVDLYTEMRSHLLLDVAGYFVEPPAPPTITLTTPASGSTRGLVNIAAATTGRHLEPVEFRVDGTLVGTDASAPYALEWRSGALANGPHTITVTVRNPVAADTDSVAVTVQNGFVSITFDDGFPEDATTVRAALESRQMFGTFYLNSEPIQAGFADAMTPQQVTALYDAGHEIGGHTARHRHLTQPDNWDNDDGTTPLTMPTQAEIEAALADCDTYLRSLIHGEPITAFASPYGEYEPDPMHPSTITKTQMLGLFTAQGYTTHRSTKYLNTTNSPTLPMELDAITVGTSTDDEIIADIARAQANGGWVVLLVHRVRAGGLDDDITATRLGALLDKIANSGTRVLPVSSALAERTG
jgi:peptidoglycan/xylan/chitin deacetylase (PgdA/CDA1 family)